MSDAYGYYATKPCCEHVVLCIVDSPEYRREIAKELGKAIRDGLTIKRDTVENIRKMPFGCKCEKKGRR